MKAVQSNAGKVVIVISVLLLLSNFIFADNIIRTAKTAKEYCEMCGCNTIYSNLFESSSTVHFTNHSTWPSGIGYTGESDKIETPFGNPQQYSVFEIPEHIVKCFMADNNSRASGYFLTKEKKYFHVKGEYLLEGEDPGGSWHQIETKIFVGAPHWKKFDFNFDFIGKDDVLRARILVKSPVDNPGESNEIVHPVNIDNLDICQYSDPSTLRDIPLLSNLEFSTGELLETFSPASKSVTILVPTGTNSITLTPTLDHRFTDVDILLNETTELTSGVESAPITIDLSTEKTPQLFIHLINNPDVTPPTCEEKTYRLEIKSVDPIVDATLIKLELSAGYLEQSNGFTGFYQYETTYTGHVPSYANIIQVHAEPNDPNATVTVNGNPLAETEYWSQDIDISQNNIIDIEVTASDGVTQKTYTVTAVGFQPITVIEPNGGETFKVGQVVPIIWEANENEVTSVSISVSINNGIDWEDILCGSGISINQPGWENYDWTIPPQVCGSGTELENKNDVLIRVQAVPNTSIYDVSGAFDITASATTRIYVDANNGNDNNDGLEWVSAKQTLTAGLELAGSMYPSLSNPIEIWVADGIYYPDPYDDNNRNTTFNIPSYVYVYGHFQGGEIDTLQRIMNNSSYASILSGDIDQDLSKTGNSYHIVTPASHSKLNGFTIKQGYENSTGKGGAGILINGVSESNRISDIEIAKCKLISHFVEDASGGAVNIKNAVDIKLRKCVFEDDTVKNGSGGAIYANVVENFVMDACTCISNMIYRDNFSGSIVGGAVLVSVYSGNSKIEKSLFSHNNDYLASFSATRINGGACAIINKSSTDNQDPFVISDCEFSWNKTYSEPVDPGATPSDGYGGAIYGQHGTMSIERCVFNNNTAVLGGAITTYQMPENLNDPSVTTFSRCKFNQNSATHGGGGYYNRKECRYDFINCTFWKNDAGTSTLPGTYGGAILSQWDWTAGIKHCSFALNEASTEATAIHITESSQQPSVWNSIFWSDNSLKLITPDVSGSGPILNNCWYKGAGWEGDGDNNIAGGETPCFIDANNGNLDIIESSDCKDSGANLGINEDINGNPRDSSPDIGAYEYQ